MTKIMLVEDDKSLREIYGVRLQAEGYDIKSAGDGEEALAMAIREKPDLILADVMMPKISGFDMLDILRSTPETRDIKVIMMTALSSEDQRARGETLGANKYLVKSQVGIEDVVRAIHEVLSDSTSPAAAPQPTPASIASPTPMAQPVIPEAPIIPSQPIITPVTAPEPIAQPIMVSEPTPRPIAPSISPMPTLGPIMDALPSLPPQPEPAPIIMAPPMPISEPTPAPIAAPANMSSVISQEIGNTPPATPAPQPPTQIN
ncbi:MAG: response regulator [Candidatus Saccharibacteria bacterium]